MHAACDGWSAGMVLMLARFDRTGIANEASPGALSMDLVFRYFAGLLFDDATPAARRGLCLAALLPRMTANEAVAQAEDPAVAEVLESMHRRHLFITRRRLPEPTFEMHALLRQFLLSRAPEVLDRGALAAGMSRAARQLEARGDGAAALALRVEMGDLQEAERTVIAFADEWLEQGRHRTIRDAIASLPPSLVVASAALSMYAGLGAMPFDQQEARRLLGDAFRGFGSADDLAGRFRSACGVVDTYAGNFSDFGSIAAWLDTLCALIDDPRFAALPEAIRLEAAGAFVFAGLYGRPGHARLRPMAERLRGMLIDTRVADEQRLRVGTWFLLFCDASEDTHFANPVVSILDAISRQPGVSPLRRMWWLLRLGFHRYLEGDLDGAHANLSTLRDLSEDEHFHAADGLMHMWDTYIRYAMPPARARTVHALLPNWRASLAPGRLPDHTYAAIADLAERVNSSPDDPAAITSARTAVELSDRIEQEWIRIAFRAPLGFTLARFGHFDEASACADVIRTRARGTCFASYGHEADAIDAYGALRRGQPQAGEDALRRWIVTAKSRPLWCRWYKAPFLELLRHAIAAGVEAADARALIARHWPDDEPAAMPMPRIAIQLLGGFAITRDGIAVSLGTRAPRRLLDLLRALAIVGNPWVSTAWLMDEFWPESDGDQARRALAVALYRLRKLLGDPEAVETSEQQVRLNPDRVVTDLSAARARLQACLPASGALNDGWTENIADALASYGGPLLPGYEAAWIVAERTRLERLAGRLRSIMADLDATSAHAINSTLTARP
jgi:LuxR family maltose regulon positive regulatory protein